MPSLERTNEVYRALTVHEAEVLAPELQSFIDEGFCDVNGWLVWSGQADFARRHEPRSSDKPQDVESFLNHVHLEDALPKPHNQDDFLRQGTAFARRLADALASRYPGTPLEVSFSFSNREMRRALEETIENYPPGGPDSVSGVVGFQRTTDYGTLGDLESFKFEAMLAIEIV